MKTSRFHITDHAVLRYLERVKGLDMKAVRAEIGAIVDLAEDHDTCRGVRSGGFVYRIEGDTVVTVAPADQPHKRLGNRQRLKRKRLPNG